MGEVRARVPSEVLRRGYSDEELSHIYELARLYLEMGNVKSAEIILSGLVEVAPDFAPGWMGMAYIQMLSKNYEAASLAARNALRVVPGSPEALLYLVACLLTLGDFNSAGSFLGEIQEKIDTGVSLPQEVVRFYRMQLARYQNRAA